MTFQGVQHNQVISGLLAELHFDNPQFPSKLSKRILNRLKIAVVTEETHRGIEYLINKIIGEFFTTPKRYMSI